MIIALRLQMNNEIYQADLIWKYSCCHDLINKAKILAAKRYKSKGVTTGLDFVLGTAIRIKDLLKSETEFLSGNTAAQIMADMQIIIIMCVSTKAVSIMVVLICLSMIYLQIYKYQTNAMYLTF